MQLLSFYPTGYLCFIIAAYSNRAVVLSTFYAPNFMEFHFRIFRMRLDL